MSPGPDGAETSRREVLSRALVEEGDRLYALALRTTRDPDLAIHTVEVQDILDWYNGGLKDPWAIKRYVNHALGQWQSWALQIVGDGNENILELRVGTAGRAGR